METVRYQGMRRTLKNNLPLCIIQLNNDGFIKGKCCVKIQRAIGRRIWPNFQRKQRALTGSRNNYTGILLLIST